MSKLRVLVSPTDEELASAGLKVEFNWTEPGELLTLGFPCDDDVDSHCGCRRAFTGVDSTRGVTIGRAVWMDRDKAIAKLKASDFYASWSEAVDGEKLVGDLDFIDQSLAELHPIQYAGVRMPADRVYLARLR
jgi:hypothetical protein